MEESKNIWRHEVSIFLRESANNFNLLYHIATSSFTFKIETVILLTVQINLITNDKKKKGRFRANAEKCLPTN
jgi:hypothetical protein